jgi:ATP-dependent Lhr-like helicase
MLLERFKPELQGIIQKSFKKFTPIQEQALPSILDGKNTLVIAPTGSGKTEAAFLPVINGLIGNDKKGIIALYIAPLRSLNRDMLRRMEEWCAALGCSVEVRHGDTTTAQRSRQRLKPPQLLMLPPDKLLLRLNQPPDKLPSKPRLTQSPTLPPPQKTPRRCKR